jgi:chromosome segregation ATPase
VTDRFLSSPFRTQIYASERKDSSVTRAGGVRKVHSYQSSKIRRVPGVANSLHTDYQADGDIETGQTSSPGQDGQWYTVTHGESARSLVEKGDVDWETLEKLNPRVDLKTTFPGDRIAVRQSLAPRERISTTFVRQESKPIVPMSRTSLLQSPVSAASLILLSGLVGAAVAGRKQLPAVYLSLMGAGKAVLEEKEREIDELKEFQLVLERELKDLRAGSMKSELALTNLKQLLENASRTDADLRDQINTLKQSLNLKVEETKRLEASNGELESRTEAYKNRLHGVEDDLEKMKHIEQKTASELAEMTASAREYEAKVLEYREKLADVEAELSALRELSEGYSNDAVEARKMHNQALEELAVQKEANDDLEKDLSEANDRVQLHIDQIEMYRADTERLERELAASRGEVSCLSSNLEDSTNKISQLETELESSRADICKYVTDLQEIRDDLESKRSELRSSEDALQNALREVTNLSHFPDELKSVKSELQDALNELTDRGHEISGLRGKVEELESALQSASGESSTMAIDIATLKGSLNQLESMLHESQTSNADYIGKLKEAESELESARDESTRLVEELERFKSQVGELESALSSAGDESSTLAVDLAGFKSKLHMAESALEDSRAEASEYKSELESARDESTRLVEELERFKSQTEINSVSDIEDYRKEIEITHSELIAAQALVAGYLEEKDLMQQKVVSLESELVSLRKITESRVASVDVDVYITKIAALEEQLAATSDSSALVDALKRQAEEAQTQASRYKERLIKLEVNMQEKIASLNASLSDVPDSSDEVLSLQQQIHELEDEKNRMATLISNLQTQIEAIRDQKRIDVLHSQMGESNARVQDMDVREARQAARLSLAQVTQTIARMKRQATGERSSTAIKCDFNVRKEVGEHQFVVLVGSWHEWDVQRGEYMSRDGDGAWCVSTSLFADEPYEYKYCVCELNDKGLRVPVEWQIGHNHGFGFDSSLITTQRVQPKVQIRDKFVADPAHTPIILFGPNGEKFETGSTALLANMSSHLAEAGMENIQSTLERLISFLS